ncbi:MAG: hypothetical protein FJW20_21410 [Acidimicrobiia bacterium]|nr:hypothetical protein [Acidimicrobiia bacterium]
MSIRRRRLLWVALLLAAIPAVIYFAWPLVENPERDAGQLIGLLHLRPGMTVADALGPFRPWRHAR